MLRPPVDIVSLFLTGLRGDGVVTGLTGRPLRSFRVEFYGQWSIGHDALHLDETVDYADGRRMLRHWAVQFDDDGRMIGYDSNQAARLRGRPGPGSLRLVYDRPLGLGGAIGAPRMVVDLTDNGQGGLTLDGRADVFGLAWQRTRASLAPV